MSVTFLPQRDRRFPSLSVSQYALCSPVAPFTLIHLSPLTTTHSLPQLARFLLSILRGNLRQMLLNTLLGVMAVIIDLAFVWATKTAIDIATHQTHPFPLTTAFLLIFALMAVRIGLYVAKSWFGVIFGVKASNTMRLNVFTTLLHGDWTALRAYHSGDLMNRLETDVDSVVNFVTVSIPSLVTTLVQFVGAFIFLFCMSPALACVVVLVLPFFALASKLFVRKLRHLTHDVRESDSRIQSLLQECLQHAMVVKTLLRMDFFASRLRSEQQELHSKIIRRGRFSITSGSVTMLGFAVGYLMAFIWGTINLERGAITYGAMLAFIQLVSKIQTPVQDLTKFVPLFIRTATSTDRLMDITLIPAEDFTAPPRPQGQLGIELRNVSFTYTEGSRQVIDHFTYSFPGGRATAIVGETGAGKTTLIKLLFSLIRPQEGDVVLTSSTGTRLPVTPAMRAWMSYVPQGNTLFSGTIRSNLLLGRPDATEADMLQALDTAEASFVKEKPLGLDTPCGETGDGLSEGQAQRIAIARALLARSPILVLDEATSALDTDTEHRVLTNIMQTLRDTTIIFITHRPEVLNHMDQTLHLKRTGSKS